MKFRVGDEESLEILSQWRALAARDVSRCTKQQVAAFYEIAAKVPGWFLSSHVGVFGKVSQHVKGKKELIQKSLNAVKKMDLISPYLSEEAITDPSNGYLSFVGEERILLELNYAFCRDLLVAAYPMQMIREYINLVPEDWDKRLKPMLHPLNTPLMLEAAKESNEVLHQKKSIVVEPPISSSIAEEASEIKEDLKTVIRSPVELSPRIESIESIDLVEHIANPTGLYSYAIISPSGGGKGMLMSNVLRRIKLVRPDIKIMLLDPKNNKEESGYWDGVVDVWHRADFMSIEVEEKVDWIHSGLDAYRHLPSPKILVLDEATSVFSVAVNNSRPLMGRLKDFVTSIASSGSTAENFLFLLGHSPGLSEYGLSGSQMASLRKIYLAPTNNVGAINDLGLTVFAGGRFGSEQVDQIVRIGNQSEVQRAVFIGATNTWYPMKKLENHSGYDRDTRTRTAKKKESVKVEPKVEEKKEDILSPLFDEFVKMLSEAIVKAFTKGMSVDSLTPEEVHRHKNAKKLGLTLDQAKKALQLAKDQSVVITSYLESK